MCNNVYDDVTNFGICEIIKNTKIQISWEPNMFLSNKKNHSLYIKGYKTVNNCFPVKVTFKEWE